MTIHIPAGELEAVAHELRTRVAPLLDAACSGATSADGESDGILHQGAASKVEAVAQKLADSCDLGQGALLGLAQGLGGVVQAFGHVDKRLAGR